MAVAEKYKSTLQLVLDEGIDPESGKQIFKFKSFNNVKTDATADQLYAIAQAVAGLQERPLYSIERDDSFEIQG
ncbi:DUF1659 domain-containing protein [Virgibacillus oceani]|uniref:DUF1659 domain-containing protein n=1 Tax=Virgibacillus oceani TaxID=1479511 RepID=A0A917HC20_9BACI|nr:DUF1659 domain-containing protein [Virgibacillus oceani]GGG74044.1 hypothetical protein GCM10011398_18260 [Virgibacillus oceani]